MPSEECSDNFYITISITYCLQALFKNWKRLLNRQAPRDILWMLMGLPLAPMERFAAALEIVTRLGDDIVPEYPGILQFLHYFRRPWQPLADFITVGRAPVRMNNICETFHRHIIAGLGGRHPNVWSFFGALTLKQLLSYDRRRYCLYFK